MERSEKFLAISQTLSGLENFLRDVLANEGLSKEADEQRREFLKKLEVVSSPPTLPPRPAKLAVEKRSPFGNVSSKEAIGSGDESQTSVYSHYRNDNIEDPVAFAQQQRELSRNFTFYSGGYAGRREVFDLPPIAGASVKKPKGSARSSGSDETIYERLSISSDKFNADDTSFSPEIRTSQDNSTNTPIGPRGTGNRSSVSRGKLAAPWFKKEIKVQEEVYVQDLENNVIQGYLKDVKANKRRWCVIKDDKLYIFKTRDDPAMHIIDLPQCNIGVDDKKKISYSFRLSQQSTGNPLVHLAIEQGHDLSPWMSAVMAAAVRRSSSYRPLSPLWNMSASMNAHSSSSLGFMSFDIKSEKDGDTISNTYEVPIELLPEMLSSSGYLPKQSTPMRSPSDDGYDAPLPPLPTELSSHNDSSSSESSSDEDDASEQHASRRDMDTTDSNAVEGTQSFIIRPDGDKILYPYHGDDERRSLRLDSDQSGTQLSYTSDDGGSGGMREDRSGSMSRKRSSTVLSTVSQDSVGSDVDMMPKPIQPPRKTSLLSGPRMKRRRKQASAESEVRFLQDPDATHSGILFQKRPLGVTSKRYCKLIGNHLICYRHPEDEKASLSLSLLGHDVTLIDSKESKRAYGFKISKPNSESYFFSTDSRVSVERWIELLSLAATGRQDIIAPYPPYFRSGASGDESKSVKSSESLSLSESYQSADSGEVADELNTSLTCSTSSSHMSAHKMDDDYLSGFAADEQEESDARELDYEGERKKRELRARSPRMRQQRERDRKLKRRKDKKKSSGGSGPESPSTMSPPHSVFVSDPASENKSTAESTATPIDTKDSYPKNQKEKKTWSDALRLKQSKLTRAHTLAGMVLGTPGHESAKSKAGPQSKRSIPSYSHLLPLFDKEGRFSGFLTEVKASKYSVTQLRRWGVVRNGVLRLYNKEGDETPVTMFNLVEMWLTDESDDAKHKYSFSLHTINDKVAKFQVPSKEDFDKWMSVLKVFTEIRVERPIDTSVDESLSHPNVMTRPKSNHSKDDPASVNTFAKRSSIRMKFPPRMNVIDMFKKGNNSYNFENPNTEDIIPANELVCINYSGGQLTEICIGDEENYSCKRSRWCAIKDSELLVFADSSSGDPVKRMVLYNVNVEDLSEPEAGVFQFKVQRGNEVAMFLAHDETSLDKWLKMLRSATEMYGREVTEPEAKCRIPSPKNVFAHRRSQSETLSQTVSLSSATSFTSTSAPEKRKSFISTSASTDSESFTDILMNGHLHEVLQAEKGSSGEKVDEHGTSRWCVVTSERIFMYDSEDSAYARCDWRLADVSVSACIEVPGRRFGFRLRHKDDEVVLGNESREVIEHWLSVMLRYCAPLGQSMSPLTQRVKLECKKSNSDSNLKRTAMDESKIKRTLSEGRASGRRLLRKISEDNILRKYSRSELFRSGSCKGSLEKFNVKLRDKSQLTSAARDIERRFSCGSLFDSEGKYSGYLVEQTSTALCRSQVRRWCVVHDEQMYLYDQPRSETPRKVIPIISAKLVNQSRLEEGVFVFMLEYEGDKCVELRAASRSDLEKWITAISVKIEVLKARVQRRARRSGVIDEEAEITTASARDTIDKQPLEKGSAEASPPTVDSDIPGSSIKPERAASDPTTYITTHKDPIPPEEGGTSDSLNDVSMSSSQQPLDIVEDIKRISLHNESEEEDGGVDGLCVTSVLWDEVTVTSDTPRVIATEPYYANVDRGSMPSEPIYENVSMKSNTLSGLVIRPSELPLPSPTHSHDDSMFVDIVPKQRTKHDLVPLYENVQLKSVLGEGESTDNVFRWKTSEVPTPNNTSPSSEVAKSLEKCSLRDRFSFASDYSGIVGENLLDEVGSVSSDRSRSNTSSSRGSGSDSMRSGNPAFDKELLDDILGFPITQEEAEEISEFCTRCDEEEQFEMSESNFISSVDPDFTSTLGEPGSLSTGDLNGSLDRAAESTPRRSLAESSTSSVHDTYFGVESISDESEEFVDCAQDLRDVSPGKSCDSFKECEEYMPCPSPSCHPKDSTPDEQQCDTFGRSSESELEKSSETESTQKDLRSDDASIVQVGRVVCSGNRQEENRVSTETLPLPASLEEEGTAETSADMHNKELTSSQVDMLRAVTEAFHGVWEGTHENTKL